MPRLNKGDTAYYWDYENGEPIVTTVAEVIIENCFYRLEDSRIGRVDANRCFPNFQELLHDVIFNLRNRIGCMELDLKILKQDKNKAINMLKHDESVLNKFHVTFDYKSKNRQKKGVYHADYIEDAHSILEITSHIGKKFLPTDFEVDWKTYKVVQI